MFSVTKNSVDHDLSNFIENVFQVNDKEENEVTIEIELKELLQENDKISIKLNCGGVNFSELALIRREND